MEIVNYLSKEVVYSTDLKSLDNANLSSVTLINPDFSHLDLRGINFTGATLINPDFAYANLANASFRYARVNCGSFGYANLTGVVAHEADMRESCFDGATMTKFDGTGANFRNASFRGAYLKDADFEYASLCHATMSEANLTNVNLQFTDMRDLSLSETVLKDAALPLLRAYPDLRDALINLIERPDKTGAWSQKYFDDNEEEMAPVVAAMINLHLEGQMLGSLVGIETAAALLYQRQFGAIPDLYAEPEETIEWLRKQTTKT